VAEWSSDALAAGHDKQMKAANPAETTVPTKPAVLFCCACALSGQ
jgi:hypothetical protein